jgi:3-phenylpropionate/trans-cinnamate dioxygenase ferredoxin subunit
LALTFKLVCQLEDLPRGEAIRVELDAGIAVFNVDGKLYAVQDSCTHAAVSLADGDVEGDTVQCYAHLARFSLRTGEVLAPPARAPLKTYAVKIEDGGVYIEDEPRKAADVA